MDDLKKEREAVFGAGAADKPEEALAEGKNTEFLEVTWKRAIKVTWSIFWREMLIVIFAAVQVGIITAIATLTSDISRTLINVLGNVFLGILDIIISVYLVKIILNKKYSDFKIVLVKP